MTAKQKPTISGPRARLDEIYPGDCGELLTELPDRSIDLIVSSPPYNLGKDYESRVALEHYVEDQSKILAQCARVLTESGSIFWQVGAYANAGYLVPLDIRFFPILENFGLIPRNRIVWVRQHGLHATRKFSCRHETILWFTKSDKHKFHLDPIRVPQKWQNKKSYRGENKGEFTCNPSGKNPGDIWLFRNVKHNHEEQTIHPCQFPEDMIARIVLATTDPEDVVFDPYMGAGTVAVVARDLGRHFLGAELDPRYYEVSQRRLSCSSDADGSFANLKCLRQYVERTRQPIGRYRFDVQVGTRATEGGKAQIFPEEHHQEEFARRIEYEESAFAAKLRGQPIPVDHDLNGRITYGSKRRDKNTKQTKLFSD